MPDQPFRLADGRALGCAEYGDPNGRPIFIFIGNASRRFYPVDDTLAQSLNARLINVERPGIGLSDPKPDRTLLDWPDDIAGLADALKLDRFAVLGGSAGGPYAAACAYKLPRRVTKLSLVSALAPFNRLGVLSGMTLAYQLIPLAARFYPKALIKMQEQIRRNPPKAWQQFHKRLPECDQELVRQYGPRYLKPAFMRDIMDELYRQGYEGLLLDIILLTRAWGFDPAKIKTPTCLWQGESDRNVPPAMGRYLARRIPNCRAHFLPNEGHLLYLRHWREILAETLAAF